MSTTLNAVAVSFEHFDPVTVRYVDKTMPLDQAEAYQHATHEWVSKVWFECHDTRLFSAPQCYWSYGKNWVYPETGRIARIGAGAYGDGTVIRYERSELR